jgi:hypothetical protein
MPHQRLYELAILIVTCRRARHCRDLGNDEPGGRSTRDILWSLSLGALTQVSTAPKELNIGFPFGHGSARGRCDEAARPGASGRSAAEGIVLRSTSAGITANALAPERGGHLDSQEIVRIVGSPRFESRSWRSAVWANDGKQGAAGVAAGQSGVFWLNDRFFLTTGPLARDAPYSGVRLP